MTFVFTKAAREGLIYKLDHKCCGIYNKPRVSITDKLHTADLP